MGLNSCGLKSWLDISDRKWRFKSETEGGFFFSNNIFQRNDSTDFERIKHFFTLQRGFKRHRVTRWRRRLRRRRRRRDGSFGFAVRGLDYLHRSRVFTFHEASLVIAGLGRGWPGAGGMGVGTTPPRCAGSEGTCIERDASWIGWMIEDFRAGTVSGVGMVSPVGGPARTGMVSPLRPAAATGTPGPLDFCLAIW